MVPPGLRQELVGLGFRGALAALSRHPCANFVVQALLSSASAPAEVRVLQRLSIHAQTVCAEARLFFCIKSWFGRASAEPWRHSIATLAPNLWSKPCSAAPLHLLGCAHVALVSFAAKVAEHSSVHRPYPPALHTDSCAGAVLPCGCKLWRPPLPPLWIKRCSIAVQALQFCWPAVSVCVHTCLSTLTSGCSCR